MKELVYIIQTPPSWIKTPPLSLIYLKTYLEKKDITVKILDLNIIAFKLLSGTAGEWLTLNRELEQNLFAFIENKYPSLLKDTYKKVKEAKYIGFSLLGRNTSFAFSLAKRIKEKFSGKEIIFGGPDTFFLDKKEKLDLQNYWVIGEGETPLFEIIKNGNQKILRFKEIDNLDNIPFLDFSPLNLYSHCIPLLSSRGCVYKCGFCSERFLSKKFRNHTPAYMADQIKYLAAKHKINTFIFCDSLINYDNEWLETFCGLVIKNKLKIKWEAQARVDRNLTQRLAKLIKESGCYNLFIGLESASNNVLKTINKGFKINTASNFFKKLNKAKLHFEISLIFGHPQETKKDFKETLRFIVKNKEIIPKIAQANPFVDYLGNFPEKTFPAQNARERINKFIKIIQKENIKYTKSFINNLTYQDGY